MHIEIEIEQRAAATDGEEEENKRKLQIFIGEEGVTFGRSQVNCEEPRFVGICDAKTSGEHLLVFQRDGDLMLKDLGSKNGTKVNQTRLKDEVKWNVGQIVEIGATTRVRLVGIKPESSLIETPTKQSSGGVVDKCFFCLRNLNKFSTLEKQLHINGCAESLQGNDTAIVQAMTNSNNSDNTNTCMVCNKSLSTLTSIQAINHINKCLDGKSPTIASDDKSTSVSNKRIKQDNKKPPAAAAATSKRKKTPGTSASFVASSSNTSGSTLDKFTFTKRTSPVVEMLGTKKDHDMFEQACESKAMAAIARFDDKEEHDVFEHTDDPFRISLSKELDLTELLRRKDYFEKQLRFCNELLECKKRQPSVYAETTASSPRSFSSFTNIVDTPTPRFPINWNGLTEMDAVLETLSSCCNELEQNDKERVDKLKV